MPQAGPGGFTIERADGGHRLLVHGEVDVAGIELLAERMSREAQRGEDLEIDLSGLEFIDIAGLWVLYEAAVELGKEGRRLTLVSPPPSVPRMLELLGWSGLAALRVEQSVDGPRGPESHASHVRA